MVSIPSASTQLQIRLNDSLAGLLLTTFEGQEHPLRVKEVRPPRPLSDRVMNWREWELVLVDEDRGDANIGAPHVAKLDLLVDPAVLEEQFALAFTADREDA